MPNTHLSDDPLPNEMTKTKKNEHITLLFKTKKKKIKLLKIDQATVLEIILVRYLDIKCLHDVTSKTFEKSQENKGTFSRQLISEHYFS